MLAVGDARASAAWLLPMLCTADVFAVIYWRRHAAAGRLFSLFPWVLLGMAAGAVALSAPERYLRLGVGAIIFLMLVAYLWRRYASSQGEITPHPVLYGAMAGFFNHDCQRGGSGDEPLPAEQEAREGRLRGNGGVGSSLSST